MVDVKADNVPVGVGLGKPSSALDDHRFGNSQSFLDLIVSAALRCQ